MHLVKKETPEWVKRSEEDKVEIVTFRSLECFNCLADDRVHMVTLRNLERFNWGVVVRVEMVT